MLMVYVNGFVQAFTKYARWSDLLLGLASVGFGIYWSNLWLVGLGALSLLAAATNFNGWVQQKTQALATAHRARIRGARK